MRRHDQQIAERILWLEDGRLRDLAAPAAGPVTAGPVKMRAAAR